MNATTVIEPIAAGWYCNWGCDWGSLGRFRLIGLQFEWSPDKPRKRSPLLRDHFVLGVSLLGFAMCVEYAGPVKP